MSAFTTEVSDSIAVVTFDLPGEPVNKLNAAVKVEFEALLIRLRDDAEIRGGGADLGQAGQLHRRRRHRRVHRAHHTRPKPSV